MGDALKLETPASPDELFYARGDEVSEFAHRPLFTGDVLRLGDARLVCAVQHPCAMRSGPKRNPVILTCAVSPFAEALPADWDSGHYKRMFLPELDPTGAYAVEFVQMALVTPEDLDRGERLAILSAFGVNLLLQRWTYHNNRVVIPTITINVQCAGPFEEADLVAEAVSDLVAAGESITEADATLERWLGDRVHGGASRRELLANAQARSTVRRELRSQLDLWLRGLEERRTADAPSAG